MEGNQLGDLWEDGSVAIILEMIFKRKVQFEDMVCHHLTQYRNQVLACC